MDLDVPSSWDDARDRLVPVLRPVTSYDSPALVRRQVAPFLHALLALDLDEVRLFVTKEHLARWGVPVDVAWGHAFETLDATDGLVHGDGVWELASGDGYESSRLLLPGWLSAFRGKVTGEPLAIVPTARKLVVGGSADPRMVLALLEMAAKGWKNEGEPVSPMVYAADGHGIAPWRPHADTPAAVRASAHASARALAAREYGRQAEKLDDAAPYELGLAAPDEDGLRPVYSFTRWIRGEDERLPEVDYVVLGTPKPVLVVPWADLHKVAGRLLERTDDAPARWRTRGWPGAEWDALKDVAVPAERLG